MYTMIQAASKRIKNLRSNLNITHIIRFIWKVSPKMTVVSLLMIALETAVFFLSLYSIKLLIDAVGANTLNPLDNPDVINSIIMAAVTGIAYINFKSLS